ncbi:MAG TPA: hypothetical protein PKW37_00790, partial [Salinivirgaceae bacterium]|nr:hypothetical protein [Salinivirgaceae bacterium]
SMIAQPVADNAIIPVSVTLNSILRLNVVSGGNIEFVVNTLDDYAAGINNGGDNARYHTTFTVASSIDFKVTMNSETPNFVSSTGGGVNPPLNNLGYELQYDGSGGSVGGDPGDSYLLCGADQETSAVQALQSNPFEIITSIDGGGAGDVAKNRFIIRWRFGTQEGIDMIKKSILEQSIAADRYTVNVFLVLSSL